MNKVKVTKLLPDQWQEYKEIRLSQLQIEPTALAYSYEEALTKTDEYWQEKTKSLSEAKNEIMFLAEVDGKIIGTLGAYWNNSPKLKHKASIFAMYVDPEFRGRGIGASLIEKVLQELTDMKFVKVMLDVNDQQQPAIRLYQKFGFKESGHRSQDLFYLGKYYDFIDMEKILNTENKS